MAPAWSFQERIQALEREEEKKVRAIEKCPSTADKEKRTAIAEVDRLQRFIIAKDTEVNKPQQELIDTRQLYRQGIERARKEERMQNLQRIMSLGRGRAITGEQRSTELLVRTLAPEFTPAAPCFMPHRWDTSGHLIRECTSFLALSNRQRAELLFQERRCFGCVLPELVVGHTAVDCPHPRYCSRCGTDNHHQILFGPREMYRGLVPIAARRK